MSFQVRNLGLNEAVSNAVRQISMKLYEGPAPLFLHHYTSAETVASIIDTRCLWATCLAEQKDQSELLHATSIVRDASLELINGGVSELAADVLGQIPRMMEERRSWFFIACFCGEHSSPHHQSTYGDYCLRFMAPWTGPSSLSVQSTAANFWYQRVIYDRTAQERAMLDGLTAVANALVKYTKGIYEGPLKEWTRDGCARIAAEQLLAMAVGFKYRDFARDEEWRLVCYPRVNPISSAPKMADEQFSVLIKSSMMKHVELTISRELNFLQPLRTPPMPFIGLFPNTKTLHQTS